MIIRHHALWYENEGTFLRYQKACVDPETFACGYKAWLEMANEFVKQKEKEGVRLRKIYAQVDEFILWCKINACAPDGAARSRFASLKGAQKAASDN